jgi:hypothetical protein
VTDATVFAVGDKHTMQPQSIGLNLNVPPSKAFKYVNVKGVPVDIGHVNFAPVLIRF